MENKGQTIFLSVIGIATLLVAIVGATFAYFTTTMSGTSGSVTVTTQKISSLSFNATGISASKVLPGWSSGATTVTISTSGATDIALDYTCSLSVTGLDSLTDLYVTTTNSTNMDSSESKCSSATNITSSGVTLFSGSFAASDSAVTKTGTYNITFKETGTNQNAEQGKTFTATVSCSSTSSGKYYNASNTNGTTTVPTAQW